MLSTVEPVASIWCSRRVTTARSVRSASPQRGEPATAAASEACRSLSVDCARVGPVGGRGRRGRSRRWMGCRLGGGLGASRRAAARWEAPTASLSPSSWWCPAAVALERGSGGAGASSDRMRFPMAATCTCGGLSVAAAAQVVTCVTGGLIVKPQGLQRCGEQRKGRAATGHIGTVREHRKGHSKGRSVVLLLRWMALWKAGRSQNLQSMIAVTGTPCALCASHDDAAAMPWWMQLPWWRRAMDTAV